MERTRLSGTRIIGIHPAGLSAKELCRKYGLGVPLFCAWRSTARRRAA